MLSGWRWQFVWPVVLATVCLVSLCAFVAVSLLHQQATVHRAISDDLKSRRAAVELEECLSDVLILERDQIEAVSALHDRAQTHLRTLVDAADEDAEREEVARLTTAFDGYLAKWRAMPPRAHPDHDAAFRDARRTLETDVLRLCHDVEQSSHRRLDQTTQEHERVLRQLAWGMAGIGVLGGVAGLVFGFGLARGLSRSVRRLQVQVRDAAGKLDPQPAEIVLTGEGDFGGLHAQIDQLAGRIETVVETLHQREREILRAEQLAAVGQLAAGVGHEIRNPLTAIKMLVQAALEDGTAGALTPDDLRVIEEEVRRIEQSLQTFLDFARPPKVERRPVDLIGVVRGVVGLVRGRAENQKVTVTLDVPPDPVVLTADANQLRQVILNLCLNALDAMPSGGALTIRVRAPAGGPVAVEVADTGPGIPPAILPRLFTPFASSKDTGLGLGLVISKRIVEGHSGTITATNRPASGASFVVELPREQAG
jgi:two-component system, NtrC family, sensor histidine kinase HydH